MPIFAVPLAKFAVSFAPQKGDYIGRAALEQQYAAFRRVMNRDFTDMADLPRRIQPITLLDRGGMRAGMPVYRGDRQIGWADWLKITTESPAAGRPLSPVGCSSVSL